MKAHTQMLSCAERVLESAYSRQADSFADGIIIVQQPIITIG